MKNSKKYKTSSTLFYISSTLFYLAAIFNFISGDATDTGIMWLCLGSAFLCIGSAFKMKSQNDNDDKNKKL